MHCHMAIDDDMTPLDQNEPNAILPTAAVLTVSCSAKIELNQPTPDLEDKEAADEMKQREVAVADRPAADKETGEDITAAKQEVEILASEKKNNNTTTTTTSAEEDKSKKIVNKKKPRGTTTSKIRSFSCPARPATFYSESNNEVLLPLTDHFSEEIICNAKASY